MIIGKQPEGFSPGSIKQMALHAMQSTGGNFFPTIADVGSGRGELSALLTNYADKIIMLDDFVPSQIPEKCVVIKSDLNNRWDIEDNSLDFLFSLEVVEHLENPRHFFREIKRVLKDGGYGFVSTPNSHNIFSRVNFFFKGCHRFFQDSCYPAHISVLMKIDFIRILSENGLSPISFHYNYEDVIPLLGIKTNFKSSQFSNSIGVLFRKTNVVDRN